MTNKKSVKKGLSEAELNKLAGAGTKEAIAKIEKYLDEVQEEDKRIAAEMALDECEMLYYQPKNDKEDEEFFLIWLIGQKEQAIDGMCRQAGMIQSKLDKFNLEKKVHNRLMKKGGAKNDDWKSRYMDDIMAWEKETLETLKEDIEYGEAWIAEAEKMVTTARYKAGIPERHLDHFDMVFNEGTSNSGCDCCDDDCCEDDCDCGDDCSCDSNHGSCCEEPINTPF